jgi:beta-1,4-mannosyltransferase
MSMRERSKIVIAIAPNNAANTFVNAFGRAIADGGFRVVGYGYGSQLPKGTDVLIMHWPDIFFSEQTEQRIAELNQLLDEWIAAKENRGLRLVWVVHNLKPHDASPGGSDLGQRFLTSLDGIIYLSKYSREAFIDTYGVNVRHELVSKHGHYRDDMLSPPRPPSATWEGIEVCYFGQIRAYKGLEDLIECADGFGGLQVTVTGFRVDSAYSAKIEALAEGRSAVRLDLRNNPLSLSELEAVIDRCHGVVLPYRSILNSGAALFALSRHRPVLCPHLGSLPEVQADVGADWLHLYRGALESSVLRSFVEYLSVAEPKACDLSAYDWGPIGQSLRQFIDRICAD